MNPASVLSSRPGGARGHRSTRGAATRVLGALLAAALTLTACGGGDESDVAVEEDSSGALLIDGEKIANGKLWKAAQEEGQLTMYSGQSEPQERALVEAFEEQTGVTVELIRIATGRLYERIQSEHSAGVIEADVIRHTDRSLWRSHAEEGVLQSYCPPSADKIVDQKLVDEKCMFWPSLQSVYAIGYNTELVKKADAPETWQDLADPKWKKSLGLTHIGVGGSAWGRDMFLRQKYGAEYWQKIAAQKPYIAGSGAIITEELARGEVEVGMVLPGTQSLSQEDGSPLATVTPKDGVPSYLEWLGVAKKAKNVNAAKVFVNWSLSKAGQKVVANDVGGYAVRADAPAPMLAGKRQPARKDIDLVVPEAAPEYETLRKSWQNEWFKMFGYQPS